MENTTITCKHCAEPIRRDDDGMAWVHVFNAERGSWYTYCQMDPSHPYGARRALTAAEPADDVCLNCSGPLADGEGEICGLCVASVAL